MLLRDWKRIALIAIAATLFAWILASMQPPRYRASALAAVGPLTDTLQPNELLRGVEVLERRTVVSTIAALASTAGTRAGAAAGSDYQIDASVVPDTHLFRVAVEGGDAARTAAIANRIPQLLGEQTRAMYKYYGVTMIAPAVTPTAPVGSGPQRPIAAGLAIGLVLGILAAYARHRRTLSRGSAP